VNATVNLSGVDLNLLHVFDALMTERSVTRAGQRVGLTQPAVSNALGRLRQVFDDELFIKTANGMVPTARAEALAMPIRAALETIRTALSANGAFTPETSERTFTLGMNDYVEFTLLPSLMHELRRVAPGIRLHVRATNRVTGLEALDTAAVDLAIGSFPAIKSWHRSESLFSENWVCVGCDCNSMLPQSDQITLDAYLAGPHLVVTSREESGNADGLLGDFDDLLRRRGLPNRRVVATIPHFLAAPFVIERTPLLATMEERLARRHLGHLGLRLFKLPFEVASFEVVQVWHRRDEADPGHRWLRTRIETLAADIAAGNFPLRKEDR
jgi:DNA-binding transcriptional LysR family regulator